VPWEAIKYVSSGVTLLAFIAAIILAIYRRSLLSRERLIELAPASERAIGQIDVAGVFRRRHRYNQ
jgi:hypothetical protein